jgi:lipopolysaccharide export LptBFGC system permease protein LptF
VGSVWSLSVGLSMLANESEITVILSSVNQPLF